MDFASLLLALVSIGLSALALYKAKSAYKMAETVIGRKNEMEDSQRLREVIVILNAAKKAARRREGGTAGNRSAGRTIQQDIQSLYDAQDALRTKVPVSWNDKQRSPANEVAREIETALKAIETVEASRDGWKDARATIQTILPILEQEERHNADRALIPAKT